MSDCSTPSSFRSRNPAREARDAREQRELENPPRPEVLQATQEQRQRESLSVFAKCRWHRLRYPANRRVGDQVVAADCPDCEKEREWIRKAVAKHGNAMFERDPEGVTWLAQQMAGHAFLRYSARPPREADA